MRTVFLPLALTDKSVEESARTILDVQEAQGSHALLISYLPLKTINLVHGRKHVNSNWQDARIVSVKLMLL